MIYGYEKRKLNVEEGNESKVTYYFQKKALPR